MAHLNPFKDDVVSTVNRIYSPALCLFPPISKLHLYEDSLDYFCSIPWCAELVDNDGIYSFLPGSRNPASDYGDQFLGKALATAEGVKHMLCSFRAGGLASLNDRSRPIKKVQTFFRSGRCLTGIGTRMHGGMVMTMIDEACNALLEINTALRKQVTIFESGVTNTGIEATFRAPVPTGGVVVATAWIDTANDQHMKMKCDIRNGDGTELVKATSTWVAVQRHL